jgi:ribose/xylose/arabinose/galactoside ABC-type transport system permease subunit
MSFFNATLLAHTDWLDGFPQAVESNGFHEVRDETQFWLSVAVIILALVIALVGLVLSYTRRANEPSA